MATMKVDLDKLKLGEVLEIEDRTGMDFTEVVRKMPTRGLAAIVMVLKRREDPAFTWEAALEFDLEAVDAVFEAASSNGLGYSEDDAADPTDEAPADATAST